jgi:hypothetical protein
MSLTRSHSEKIAEKPGKKPITEKIDKVKERELNYEKNSNVYW